MINSQVGHQNGGPEQNRFQSLFPWGKGSVGFIRLPRKQRSKLKMWFSLVVVALAAMAVDAAPTGRRLQPRQNVTTASERLGLQWLGGNSSLPKILYELHRSGSFAFG